MGAPFRGPHRGAPLRVRHRAFLVILILGLFEQQRLFFLYRDALAAKYSPTEFDFDFDRLRSQLWRLDDEDEQLQHDLLGNGDSWSTLGSGWEGTTFAYDDMAIKTFAPGRSPFRNCVPGKPPLKWPTEIPASLYFGNLLDSEGSTSTLRETRRYPAGFLPVKSYFIAGAVSAPSDQWHLVTPLIQGNLNYIADNVHRRSYRELDLRYRPAFNRVLRALESMHYAGFCHDDIKPSNIFVQGDSQWILGDLGNVRHVSHPYHSSRLWKDNGQLPDCRANDAVRALKSYLQFLRQASYDAEALDLEFFERRDPLSRLFWATVRSPSATARDLRTRSLEEAPILSSNVSFTASSSPRPHSLLPHLVSGKALLGHRVDSILRTRVSESLARWAAMTWLFGIPESSC